MEYIIRSLEEMDEFASNIASTIEPKKEAFVLALKGELGAGKTAFSQAFARSLGVSESVTSPTYVIQKIYPLHEGSFKKLVHIDAYRLEKEEELVVLGFKELLKESSTIIIIEWPLRVSSLIPKDALWIQFDHVEEGIRKVSIES